MSSSVPPNVFVSAHPCLKAKLSLLRSSSTSSRDTKTLINDIALILAIEATARGVSVQSGPVDKTPLAAEYTTTAISPASISIVPILRSGLGMLDAVQSVFPSPVPVHHLGLFREPTTLSPVEYYNNLPYHSPPSPTGISPNAAAAKLAFLIDPIIATGGTCAAAIQTLKEWGVERVIVIAVLGALPGVLRAAQEWPEGTEIWVAGLDEKLNERGMIVPGVGDVGNRLFLSIGK